jgi:nucleotide-binding universal stress UspA family protein
MKIKKLLFVTKFEDLWFDKVQSLLDLQKADLNHVVFLNVIQREKVALHRGAGYQKKEEIRLREKANIRFIDWAETLFERGLEVGAYIVVGTMVQQVISAAQKEAADLIVIGRQNKSKIETLLTGSDITEIIRRTGLPILVCKDLPSEGKLTEKPFARPLLATNWSPASQRAVEFLRPLKQVVEQVHVIHVADEKDLTSASAMAIQKTRKDSRAKLETICDTLETYGINARAHVYIGETLDQIEKAARECQATMIIIGTPYRGHWKERLTGSISQALADKSVFPTLLIPPAPEKDQ